MKLEQISSWNSYEAIKHELKNAEIESWLLEQGPITKRIKSMKKFKLELIQLVFKNVIKISFVAILYSSDFVFIIGFCGQ